MHSQVVQKYFLHAPAVNLCIYRTIYNKTNILIGRPTTHFHTDVFHTFFIQGFLSPALFWLISSIHRKLTNLKSLDCNFAEIMSHYLADSITEVLSCF